MTTLTFLGTGNYLAPGRYWNSFVIDGTVLVEPAPSALANLRKCDIAAEAIDAVVISHFHADHTFGWPFLLLEFVMTRLRTRTTSPLFVVGPPGVEAFLADMLQLGGVPNVHQAAASIDIRYVEVDGAWQEAGELRFRAVEVEHVPHLDCYGYLFDRNGRTIGYSGDTQPCRGLDELAAAADALVLECNARHPSPTHMDVASVRSLRERYPAPAFVLTHLGGAYDDVAIDNTVIPDDFETVEA